MNKKEIREQILLNLLVGKFKDEDVTADLVMRVENEFYQVNKELGNREKEGNRKGLNANGIAELGIQ